MPAESLMIARPTLFYSSDLLTTLQENASMALEPERRCEGACLGAPNVLPLLHSPSLDTRTLTRSVVSVLNLLTSTQLLNEVWSSRISELLNGQF